MPIKWLDIHDLDGSLRRDYPPIGLQLRVVVHAAIADEESLRARLPQPSRSVHDVELPAGTTRAWAGVADGAPFAIALVDVEGKPGIAVMAPVRFRESTLDGTALGMLSALPIPWSACKAIVLESLPSRGPGWAVLDREGVERFRASERADAEAAVALLDTSPEGPFSIIEAAPPSAAWLVIGPRSGRFVSRVDIAYSANAATDLAERLRSETGASFDIYAVGCA